LRFRSTGTGVNRQESVPLVILATEHITEFELVDPLPNGAHLFVNLGTDRFIARFLGKLYERNGVAQAALEILPPVDPVIQSADLQHDLLRGDVVIPEARRLCLRLKSSNLAFLPVNVKDNL
jgi:hypothetical protein